MEYAQYDVAIIGLGPAGSTLAGFLSRNLKVIAIDKKAGSGGFEKPCGGLLAPDAQKSLSRLGLALPLDVLAGPQTFSVHTIDLKAGLERHYRRHYINLDRRRFDEWLISLIPGHVDIRRAAVCTRIERNGGGYLVSYRQNGIITTVSARYVVGADGANSVVRKTLFPKSKIRSYLCVQQWFSGVSMPPSYVCVFDRGATDCYAWGLQKGEHFIFGGAFPQKTAKTAFSALKEKLSARGFRLNAPVKTEACLTLRPRGPFSFCTGKNGAFLIGEAAGFISPSSLEGISYALDSGFLLSRVLNKNGKRPNRAYAVASLKIRAKLVLKNIKSIFMYNPLLRKIILKTGFRSIPVFRREDTAY